MSPYAPVQSYTWLAHDVRLPLFLVVRSTSLTQQKLRSHALFSPKSISLSGGQKGLANTAEATLSRALSPIMTDQVTSVQAMYICIL